MNLSFPYGISTNGMTSTSNAETHIKECIEAVLFTQPGERVNRPTFGAGAAHLVFALNGGELASAHQLLIQGALQQTLGDRIAIESVVVTADDSTLRITVSYSIRPNSQRGTASFVRSL